MANLIQTLRRRPAREENRDAPQISLGQWAQYFGYGGLDYGYLPGSANVQMTQQGRREEIGSDFRGFAEGIYKSNGIVFACNVTRALLFSEARFQFRQRRSGRPGDLFGTDALGLLENPWPNGTTGDLLMRMIQDADLAGNAYVARRSRTRLERLRPDWVTIVMGSNTPARPDRDATVDDLDVEVIGYAYWPGGVQAGREPEILLAPDVAHFAPIPDPTAKFRGMSWMTPVVREIMGDNAATSHKLQYFENAATPNLVIIGRHLKRDQAQDIQQAIWERHAGIANAYDNLVLGGVDDVKVVGGDLRQISFKETQGHGETRIAAAAGVPPIIVGLSEGLEASTYSNYAQAKRRFADGTLRPLWRNAAASLAQLVTVPRGAELWYDDRDIPFLQEDIRDAADIQAVEAGTISTLIDAGFDPEAAVDAVVAGDLGRLRGSHTGLVSVQLQPPGEGTSADPASVPEPATNGTNGRRLLARFVAEQQ